MVNQVAVEFEFFVEGIGLVSIYLYKVVILVCFFVCPANHKPFHQFASNSDWGTW